MDTLADLNASTANPNVAYEAGNPNTGKEMKSDDLFDPFGGNKFETNWDGLNLNANNSTPTVSSKAEAPNQNNDLFSGLGIVFFKYHTIFSMIVH